MKNTLNRSVDLFRKILFFNASVLFAMTLQRLVLFLVVVRHWLFGADGFTMASSFGAGLRFDLCVLGFLNIPVLFFVWLISSERVVKSSLQPVPLFRKWGLAVYLALTTLAIHVLALFDMMYFAGNGRRWTYSDWQETGLSFVTQVGGKWGALFTTGVVLLFLLLWVFRCLHSLYRVRIYNVNEEPLKFAHSMPAMIFLGIVLPIFIVALAARGTWTAHHINIQDAQVSPNQALNHLALSPAWAFDKKF